MKFSDDFLSVINRTSDSQFGTGYYGRIDDEYATPVQEQESNISEDKQETSSGIINKVSAFLLNPIASSVVIGGKKLFEPTTTEYGKTTTFAEQAVNINTRDALSLNVTSRQKELMDTEVNGYQKLKKRRIIYRVRKNIYNSKIN